MQLAIHPVARRLMLALAFVNGVATCTIVVLFVVKKVQAIEIATDIIVHMVLGFLILPFTTALVFVPAILNRYPAWVVRIFGESYLTRLRFEADLAWKMIVRGTRWE
ncbi:hypothetical protein [Dyella sedimenti]|uniref:hypothetical protein n=1 Tax=Dyella sedimenti TaxID=2919947 RepID=UPI001FA94D58|nr:hypothetical protein [Dyella sedimenti]